VKQLIWSQLDPDERGAALARPARRDDAQLQAKASGLVHLIAGSPEYQFV